MSESQRAKQLAFNGVWRGLKSQGFERSTVDGTCKYRGAEGRCCAAGWLIRDEDYSPHMEGAVVGLEGSIQSDRDRSVTSALCRTFEQFDEPAPLAFIDLCQCLHDTLCNNTPKMMEASLRALAAEHNLTIPDGD